MSVVILETSEPIDDVPDKSQRELFGNPAKDLWEVFNVLKNFVGILSVPIIGIQSAET